MSEGEKMKKKKREVSEEEKMRKKKRQKTESVQQQNINIQLWATKRPTR